MRIESEIADAIEKRVRSEFDEIASKLTGPEREKMQEKLGQIREMVAKALPETGLRDITEYGRAVHAEMSALSSVGRTGATTRGATLFCTTFPCHTCAKHIAAAGISRVVFVEPYPKSKARDLHSDAIDLVGEALGESRKSDLTATVAEERTRFEPFLGVGPRRYFDLFSMRLGTGRSVKRKHDNGDALKFDPSIATPRIPLATTTYLDEEIEAAGIVEDARSYLKQRTLDEKKSSNRSELAERKVTK
jgi:cytidine deaminase